MYIRANPWPNTNAGRPATPVSAIVSASPPPLCLDIPALFAENSRLTFGRHFRSFAMKILKDDTVKIISGKDKSVTGKVESVDHQKRTLVVEGVNMVYKHVKPSQKNPQGGRLHIALPIPSSKVMAICPKTNKPTRIGYRFRDDGVKERFARVSGESMGEVSTPRK